MPRFRTIVLPLLLLLISAVTASAATYWVSPTGSSSASGADSLSNAKTLAWFNANAVAGDVCRFKSGTYSDPIKPAHDGTASSRIRYYGFPQSPGAVTVSDIVFGYQKGSYCTARWFRSSGSITGCDGAAGLYTVGDSIASCTATSGGINILGKSCVFDSLRISGSITATWQTHWINMYVAGNPAPWFSTNNLISNCTFSPTVNTTASQGDVHIVGMCHTHSNRFVNNTFNITVTACYGYFFPVELYESYYNAFQRNTWNINLVGSANGSRGIWSHRDSSSYNRYFENNVTVTGSGGNLSFMLSNPGAYPGTTNHNYYGNNVIRDDSAQPGTGVFWYYDGCRQDTVQFNTITNNAGIPAVLVQTGTVDGCVFRHNTYVTSGRIAFDVSRASALNGARSVSDIFYAQTANASGSENARVPSGFGMDSSGVYFSPGGTATRALAVGGTSGTAPGSGGVYGVAGAARWGSPQFTDSTYSTFDGRLGASSYAVSAGLNGGYAGAIPFGGGASDVTPPATVSNLAVSTLGPSGLSVSWTAPGNDGMTGTAAAYDLRWSSSAITALNFASATPVAVQPIPAVAGTLQTWVATGLAGGTTYHYAIRARDATGNWSGVSNSASGTTTAGDTTPPAAIQDLRTGQ